MDDTGVYQTLPWEFQGWHAGGQANNELIGFEICEPKDYADKEYFETVKKKAIDLCVYLCKKYNLTADTITTHCEGYARHGGKYASNHSDIHHWWKTYHNYDIGKFREDVRKRLESEGNKMEFKSGSDALGYLVETGRIQDKEYWTKVLETTRQVEYIFIKWAQDVARIENN